MSKSSSLKYRLVKYHTYRGVYKAIIKNRKNGNIDLLMLSAFPISLQKNLPAKELLYCDPLSELENLGKTAYQYLEMGKYRGISKEAKTFLEAARKQEQIGDGQ